MIGATDYLYKLIVRGLAGLLGGALFWTVPGAILMVLLYLFSDDLWARSSQLATWVLILTVVGGLLGLFIRVGGGILSGMLVGSLIGYLIWQMTADAVATGGSLAETDRYFFYIILLMQALFGTFLGAVGGAIGGGVAGLVGDSPIGRDGIRAPLSEPAVFTGILALPLLYYAYILVVPFLPYLLSYIVFGEEVALPDEDDIKVSRLWFCLALPGGIVLGWKLIRLLRLIDDRYFRQGHQPLITASLLDGLQRSLQEELVPLALGLALEYFSNTVVRSYFGETWIGVGVLLGVALGTWLQSLVRVRYGVDTIPQPSGTVRLWATVTAAVLIAAFQIYVLPDF